MSHVKRIRIDEVMFLTGLTQGQRAEFHQSVLPWNLGTVSQHYTREILWPCSLSRSYRQRAFIQKQTRAC